jgi:hypothetical protein
VTRTADRVHVAAGPDREWLYVRNPVDPRRVSATLVDHKSQTLVVYDESDLRNTLGIRGWADVLTLGFDMAVLSELPETSESRSTGTLTFSRYATRSPVNGVREVWWNQSALLPLEVAKGEREAERTVVISIDRVSRDVAAQLLEPPAQRFPDYRRVDYPDWLEWLSER